MSITDRLEEIQARIDHSANTFGEDLLLPGDADAADLVAALRAVLDVCEKSEMGSYPEPKYDEYVPGQLDTTERVRAAIASALGEA